MSTIPFSNFTKGELARELQARIDTSQYVASARKVRNFIIQRYGGLSLRPGFRVVAEVDDVTKDTRYIPFQYNLEQSYVIALENQRARLLAQGGVILEEDLNITAITKEVTPLVSVAYHAYVVGDRINFSGILGMTELNGRSGIVTSVPSAGSFRININTSGFTAFISSSGATRVGAPTPPPAPAAPPTPPTAPPVTAPTTSSGGSGTNTGELVGWTPDFGLHGGTKETY